MALQKAVVPGRQLAQALIAVAEQHLRGGKLAARLQGPAEVVVADPRHQAGGLHLADFALDLEIARPHQHGPQAFARFLGGVGGGQDGKGVVLVAGGPPGRAQGLDVVAQGDPLGLALHAVAAVEVDQLPRAKGQVQAGRGGLVQPDGAAALVFQQGGPGDDVGLGKDAVQQGDGQAVDGVPQLEAEGLAGAVLRAGGGQAGQGVFAGDGFGRNKAEVRRPAAVGAGQAQAADPVIPYAAAGVFLAEGVQGIVPPAVHPGGLGGKAAVGIKLQAAQVAAADGWAVVQVMDHTLAVGPHLIAGVEGVQGDQSGFVVDADTHGGILLTLQNKPEKGAQP